MCQYQSGQIHVRLAAGKEAISNDDSPAQIYSDNNKTLTQ